MSRRPITLFTGQWADLPIEELAQMVGKKGLGYDGLELACWGNHFEPEKATAAYCRRKRTLLAANGLDVFAVSTHLVGQAICDIIDQRHKLILPPEIFGDGDTEGVHQRAIRRVIQTIKAAAMLGVECVNFFVGSDVWAKWYAFPPTSQADWQAGFERFGKAMRSILRACAKYGVYVLLEVHPTEIAFDIVTSRRALAVVIKYNPDTHQWFGFNYDPSHLLWQRVDYLKFLSVFRDRVHHTHMKDVAISLDLEEASILGGMLDFGDADRPWDFCSIGHGGDLPNHVGVNFVAIMRVLNAIKYGGPLSVEWEDPHMAREHGAAESLAFLRRIQFPAPAAAFDKAFEK